MLKLTGCFRGLSLGSKYSLIKKVTYILCCTITFLGCKSEENKFEDDFYENLNNARYDKVISFDLKSIALFEWDELIVFIGNESIPTMAHEITPFIPGETEEIATDHDRYYFIHNKKVVKKFDLENNSGAQQYDLNDCGNKVIKKEYCEFRMMANTKDIEAGTIFLFPTCIELPDWVKNRDK